MSTIPTEDYPAPRPWNMKAQAAPNIPRGSVGMAGALRIILKDVANEKPQTSPVSIPGSDSAVTLEVCCQRLRPIGLVRGKNGSWSLSEEAEKWLDSEDNNYLGATLCANTKYMGEILYLLQEPMRASQLQEIANNKYFMSWKKNSEINRRTVWLRDLGLVEFQEHSMLYNLTDAGKNLLESIQITSPELVASGEVLEDVSTYSASPWALELCKMNQEALLSRKSSIGYCPGGKSELISTLSAYVSFLETPKTKEEIENFSVTNYDIKASSARSLLTMLSGINFAERVSRDEYQATNLATTWNKDANPLDLCCCLHAACFFVFELLQELKDGPKNKKDLSVASFVKYEFEKENGAEVLKRIHFLRLAGLLKDYRSSEFAITQAGEELLEYVSTQNSYDENGDYEKTTATVETASQNDKLLTELHLASKDSANPKRFEQICAEAFRKLGFKAEWLGESGETDVLVSTYSATEYAYRVTVDAKSTTNKLVNESQLNFDTLTDHRKLHNAHFTVVIGCDFQGDRIVSRATKHKILLLDVESLCELIRLHEQAPLSAQDYKALFETCGRADLNVLKTERSRLTRSGVMLHAIMDCLASESGDEISKGMLSVHELCLLLKNQHEDLKPEEIENILSVLSSPMINCVGKTKDKYYAIGSLNEASNKFSFYANACLTN